MLPDNFYISSFFATLKQSGFSHVVLRRLFSGEMRCWWLVDAIFWTILLTVGWKFRQIPKLEKCGFYNRISRSLNPSRQVYVFRNRVQTAGDLFFKKRQQQLFISKRLKINSWIFGGKTSGIQVWRNNRNKDERINQKINKQWHVRRQREAAAIKLSVNRKTSVKRWTEAERRNGLLKNSCHWAVAAAAAAAQVGNKERALTQH